MSEARSENSSVIDSASVPSIAATFRLQWEEAQDCYVILYPEGMVKLSQSAGEIMKRIDGNTPVAEIVTQLNSAFGVTDTTADVLQFLEVACKNGWITHTK